MPWQGKTAAPPARKRGRPSRSAANAKKENAPKPPVVKIAAATPSAALAAADAVAAAAVAGRLSLPLDKCHACQTEKESAAILICDGCEAEICLDCAGWSRADQAPTFVCRNCIALDANTQQNFVGSSFAPRERRHE